jgi:hypothetical protein
VRDRGEIWGSHTDIKSRKQHRRRRSARIGGAIPTSPHLPHKEKEKAFLQGKKRFQKKKRFKNTGLQPSGITRFEGFAPLQLFVRLGGSM